MLIYLSNVQKKKQFVSDIVLFVWLMNIFCQLHYYISYNRDICA